MESPAQRNIDFNVDYLRTPTGFLRVLEAVAALSGLISGAIGSHCIFDGRYSFFIFVTIKAFIESTFIIILYALQLDTKLIQATQINLPVSFLINDTISLFLYFIASILVMLSIGSCYWYVAARIFASLFSIASFLILIGIVYLDHNSWRQQQQETSNEVAPAGTTVTHSSPTVLA